MNRSILTFLVVLMAALICVSTAPAQKPRLANPNTQQGFAYYPLFSAKTYTLSTTDTSASMRVAAAQYVSIKTTYNDSIYVITHVDYSIDNSTWTTIKSDTINQTGTGPITTSTLKEFFLRQPGTNTIPGLTGYIRTRNIRQATIIGVTTPTYTQNVNYVP